MKLGKIINLLKAVQFNNPDRSDVVILDRMGSDILKKMVLYDMDSVTLPSRFEVFYVTPNIVTRMLKNVLKYINKSKNVKFAAFLFQMYLLSCIEYIKPKVVVTFIDNNRHYQVLSRFYKLAEFYYITNGTRSISDTDHKVSLTNLICWGEYDIHRYRESKHQVDKFHSVGPLISSYYKTEIAPKNASIAYDICLVSQYRTQIMEGSSDLLLKDNLLYLDLFIKKYIDHNNVSVCVATCSQDTNDLFKEISYFKQVYGDKVEIIKNDRQNFSTYKAMDKSSVIISGHSTAAFEAYSWGKKILLLNFLKDPFFDVMIKDIIVREPDYLEFEAKLNSLLKIHYDEYNKLTKKNREYIVYFNPKRPTHRYLREIITGNLDNAMEE